MYLLDFQISLMFTFGTFDFGAKLIIAESNFFASSVNEDTVECKCVEKINAKVSCSSFCIICNEYGGLDGLAFITISGRLLIV